MLVVSIIGGRANLIKAEPIHHALLSEGVRHVLVDTEVIRKPVGPSLYADLKLPDPIRTVESHREKTYLDRTKALTREFKKILAELSPDYVLVYGDLDPGVAGAIAATQLCIPVGHVEAGLRHLDFDDTEEFNRVMLDRLSNHLFANSDDSRRTLLSEGFPDERVLVVGNTIITALKRHLAKANVSYVTQQGLHPKEYGVVSFHREENLTSRERLEQIVLGLEQLSQHFKIIILLYQPTQAALINYFDKLPFDENPNLLIRTSISFHDYLGLLTESAFVVTDSSGIQDETTYLGIPCFTMRERTHRAETITLGTNRVIGTRSETIEAVMSLISGTTPGANLYPTEWDMDTGSEISRVIRESINGSL